MKRIIIQAVRVDSRERGLRYVALITETRIREIAESATEAMRRLFDNHGWRGLNVWFMDSRGESELVGTAEEFAAIVATA